MKREARAGRRAIEAAVLSPAEHYQRPADVLEDGRLTREEQRRILESWVRDAEQLSQAEDENMAGHGDPPLREAHQALLALAERERADDRRRIR